MKACSKASVHLLAMIEQLLPYRINLNHKVFQWRKETAYHPNAAANRNYFPPSVRLLISGITFTDTMNNLNKRTWSPRIQKLNNRLFWWKYKPLGVALTPAFCGQWIKKTVMETVQREVWRWHKTDSRLLPVSAPFKNQWKLLNLKIITMKSKLSWQEVFQRTVVFM